jgi:hypothetical protein
MIELKRFGGAPNGYPFAPLWKMQAVWKSRTNKIWRKANSGIGSVGISVK